MSATLSQIRSGLKTNLDAVFADTQWQVFSEAQMDPVPPSIDIAPAHPVSIEYDAAFAGGGDEYLLIIRAIAQESVYTNSQQQLDRLMDARSATGIKAAVEADGTLGGIVGGTRVLRCSGYHQVGTKEQGVYLLIVEFLVHVAA